MRLFSRLFTDLDSTTSTNAKVDALQRYFAQAPAEDAAWAVYFGSGGKPRQVVATARLRVLACEVAGCTALCQLRLGQAEAALASAQAVLARLQQDPAVYPAHETIRTRWLCQQVLEALGDQHARSMIEQLFADVLARATELTGAADRDRLIHTMPTFRDIAAAHQRLVSGPPPVG